MSITPLWQKYLEVKKDYEKEILMYRLGDFFEMFDDDAKKASQILGLTLTGRDVGLENRRPMCGVPYHTLDKYIKDLEEAGETIVVCDRTPTENNIKVYGINVQNKEEKVESVQPIKKTSSNTILISINAKQYVGTKNNFSQFVMPIGSKYEGCKFYHNAKYISKEVAENETILNLKCKDDFTIRLYKGQSKIEADDIYELSISDFQKALEPQINKDEVSKAR